MAHNDTKYGESSTSRVPRRVHLGSHSCAPDLDPTKRILLERLHALILAHNAAKIAEKPTEESVTNLGGARPAHGKSKTGNKAEEKEDRSELPNIFPLSPASPGSPPHWESRLCTHESTYDLTSRDCAAEDEYEIFNKI